MWAGYWRLIAEVFCLGCCSSDSMCYILMLFSLDCCTSVKFVLLSLCWAALWPWYSVNVELLYADLYCGLGIICGFFCCLRSQPLAKKHMLHFCIVHKYSKWEKTFDIVCISGISDTILFAFLMAPFFLWVTVGKVFGWGILDVFCESVGSKTAPGEKSSRTHFPL